jgi:Family of unknown function (DUF6069)
VTESQFQRWVEPSEHRVSVDAGRMWAGGAATAVVAALVAFVGALIIRGVFGVPIIAPGNTPGTIDYVGAVWVGAFSALGTLLATALAHILVLIAPRPMVFFGWIIGLATLATAVWPFSVTVADNVRLANSVLYLVIGVAIGALLANTANGAVRHLPEHGWREQGWQTRSRREDPPTLW